MMPNAQVKKQIYEANINIDMTSTIFLKNYDK